MPANLFVASFIGSPAMNLIRAAVTVSGDVVSVTIAEQSVRLAPGAVDRYPRLRDRDGAEVIVGIRPEHFAMMGDIAADDDQMIDVTVGLAEAMGADVHIHAELDVVPPPIDGAMVDPDADVEGLPVDKTPIIARVDGVHLVAMGQHVRLAVKTHLLHFFDPSSGEPLR